MGSGAVFFGIDYSKIGENKILNDLNTDIYDGFKLLQIASVDIKDYPDIIYSKEVPELNAYSKLKGLTGADEMVRLAFMTCNTFGGMGRGHIYKNTSIIPKLKNLQIYKDRLKGAVILHEDYAKVIEEYDSPETFFFLDPPYEASKGIYKHHAIDYTKMNSILQALKGKFILTINDSAAVRDYFKGFKMSAVRVTGGSHRADESKSSLHTNVGLGARDELFITNY